MLEIANVLFMRQSFLIQTFNFSSIFKLLTTYKRQNSSVYGHLLIDIKTFFIYHNNSNMIKLNASLGQTLLK